MLTAERSNPELRYKHFLEINYGVRTGNFKIDEAHRNCH
jgi:hypothetical protein